MKMMRIPYMPCLAAGLVVLFLFCAACTSGPSGQAPPAGNTTATTGGFSAITANGSSQPERFTLAEAESAALQQNQSFFYLRGEHVDSSGKAERWIFGIHEGNTSSMQVYDATGVATLALPEGLPVKEDIPAGVLSPADIMKIASSSPGAGPLNLAEGMATLELMNGEYTVTGPGSVSQGIAINATTGELIAAHD